MCAEFNRALGEEGMSLEFQHMASDPILYSSHHLCEDLLHLASDPILYSSHNLCEDLRYKVVLQQLCSLPFHYFSDLTAVLFPALISCCYNNHSNKHILEQELSCVLFTNFFEDMASDPILYSSHHLCEDLLHMASYLILYSSHHLCEDLLHEVILRMGYITVLHADNQVTHHFFISFFVAF
ncbi:hypothetical protein ACOMHN_051171 [Nucella lapillus]